MKYTSNDVDKVTRTVLGEATAGNIQEAQAVANTIANRAYQTGKSPASIATAHNPQGTYQYTAWSPRYGNKNVNISENDPRYQSVRNVVEGVLSGNVPDNTDMATNYYSPAGLRAQGLPTPNWAGDINNRIGAQIFGTTAPWRSVDRNAFESAANISSDTVAANHLPYSRSEANVSQLMARDTAPQSLGDTLKSVLGAPISGGINALNAGLGAWSGLFGSTPGTPQSQDVPSAASMGTRPSFPGSPTPLSAYVSSSVDRGPDLSAPQSTANHSGYEGNPARTMGPTPSSVPSYGMTASKSYVPGAASSAFLGGVTQDAFNAAQPQKPTFTTTRSLNPNYQSEMNAYNALNTDTNVPSFEATPPTSLSMVTPGSFEQAFAPQVQPQIQAPRPKMPQQYITRRIQMPVPQLARQAPAAPQQAPAAQSAPDWGSGFKAALEAINSGRNITGNGAYETSNSNAYGPTTYGTQSFQGGDHSTLGGGDGHRAL